MVQYIGDGAPEGVSIQTGITEKLSFYGVTPVVQPSGAGQAAATNTTTTTSTTTALTTDLDALRVEVNAIRTALVALGLIAGA